MAMTVRLLLTDVHDLVRAGPVQYLGMSADYYRGRRSGQRPRVSCHTGKNSPVNRIANILFYIWKDILRRIFMVSPALQATEVNNRMLNENCKR